ncbi:hypothetical protein TrLO_g3856 [Triparma laevis f. longispina]|uniref:Uncharacterized protein n=1 Tax=Triparma laevis f. longispina TaxID=1714387 RepID=A0A9W7F2G4_9STRA|nr:hypothetical protein TrLO_g3856 [Triparma laevis f. longispina]
MSLSSWVGLARNGLCCLKDLFPSLASPITSTWLWSKISLLPPFPLLTTLLPTDLLAAFSQTTWLELLIFPLQTFAMIWLTKTGFLGVQASISNLNSIPKWEASLEGCKRNLTSINSDDDGDSTVRKSGRSRTPSKKLKERNYSLSGLAPSSPSILLASTLLLETSLKDYKTQKLKDLMESFSCLIIGPAFFWLSCNSLHVTSTSYIGGIDGVIIALCFMEVALVPCLIFMFWKAEDQKKMERKMEAFAEWGFDGDLAFDTDKPDKNLFDWVCSAVEIRSSTSIQSADETPKKKDRDAEDVMLYELSLFEGFGSESEKNSTIYPWWGGAEKDFDELTKEAFGTVVSGIEAVSDSNALIHDALPFIQGGGERLALEVYRLWAYFFLNFFAFYGYLMAPVTYYTPVGHNGLSDFLKFRMSDEDADWAGNFAGDLCWTIEPASKRLEVRDH